MGRKNSVLIGQVCLTVATAGLGMLELIPKDKINLFVGVGIALRLTQGYMDCLV